ncbi:hypothetical protein FRB94_002637 [Tulasnella sp. JGI-2019a]|nr:hypothetical protein FRB94_002637 [Tulasnella sp. JGI-2019a]
MGQLAINNSTGQAYINVIFVMPFPGDPMSDDYETNILDIVPWVWVIRHVQLKLESMANPMMMGFKLLTSEYVRDCLQNFQLHCTFDTNN